MSYKIQRNLRKSIEFNEVHTYKYHQMIYSRNICQCSEYKNMSCVKLRLMNMTLNLNKMYTWLFQD